MTNFKEEGNGKRELVTIDYLGACETTLGSTKADLDPKILMSSEQKFDPLLEKIKFWKPKRGPIPVPHRDIDLDLKLAPSSLLSSTCNNFRTHPIAAITLKRCVEKKMRKEFNSSLEVTIRECPTCFFLVLVPKVEPKCPRCATHMLVQDKLNKKRKLDLNLPAQTEGDINQPCF